MTAQLEVSPEVEERLRAIVREEMDRRLAGVRADWSHEKMAAAMDRIVARREGIAMPPEELEAILEEHRREMGRGPLTDDD